MESEPNGKPLRPTVPGLRERNKAAKEAAIRRAAKQLFLERGYEATTLKAVAETADVGFGTVFSYAVDKSGLLAMVFVEELKALPALFSGLRPTTDVLGDLCEGLRPLYAFWAVSPTLSQKVLQQMEFYSSGPHTQTILARRRQIRDELVAWLQGRAAARTIDPTADLEAAADTLFAIYTSAIREWSAAGSADVEAGVAQLRRLLVLAVKGLAAGVGAP